MADDVEGVARLLCAARGQDPDEAVFADGTRWNHDGDRLDRPARKQLRWQTYTAAARALARLRAAEGAGGGEIEGAGTAVACEEPIDTSPGGGMSRAVAPATPAREEGADAQHDI